MRRLLILSTVLAVSTAMLGACDPKSEMPNKPVASPSASPVKPGTTPEVKKTDDKKTPDANGVNKDVKLQGTPIKSPQ